MLKETGIFSAEALTTRTNEGVTLVAPIDIVPEEAGNVTATDLLLYHLVGTNIYADDFDIGSQRLISTLHPSGAQMRVRKDESGEILFDNQPSRREVLGQNG